MSSMPTMTIEQALKLAVGHHTAGRLAEAEKMYRQILAVAPNHADALHLLGALAGQMGKRQAGIDLIRRAIALAPDRPAYHSNLAGILYDAGRLDDAIACLRRALQLNADYAEGHYNLGNALKDKGQLDQAIACYQRAITLKPQHVDAHNNLGNAWKDKGRPDEAMACYRRAAELRPDGADAHNNLGNAFKDKGQLDQAIASYQRAVATRQVRAHDNLLFALLFHPASDSQSLFAAAQQWNQQHAEPLKQFIRPHANDRNPDRRLKIGYVSPDFHEHVVARNLMPLFRQHDHANFEIFCYAQVARPDAVTQRLRAYADHWRSIVELSDEQAADRIRQDGIDILVDLALHTADNRLLIFARKPAPVQVSFAGYPGSTGLRAIDYRLTDPHLDPPGLNDRYCSETSFRLPHSFWCFDPLEDQVAVNELPALQAGYVTFGCLNNFCKVNEGVLRLWGKVLAAAQNSRLILLAPEGGHRQSCLQVLTSQGVDPQRVEFVTHRPRPEYLATYNRIDIGLDTLPYNGHSTSLDSFWMGVPVVTLVGQTVVGRAGLSQLTNLGLADLAAHTPEQFVHIAAGLAKDLSRLSDLRRGLRQRMEHSPLMDAAGFARGIEAAYRTMWKTWCVSA